MKNKPLTNKENLPAFQNRRQYIEVPLSMKCGTVRILWRKFIGIFLVPFYTIAALILRGPGGTVHFKCALLAIRLLLLGRISIRKCHAFVYSPMDSTRYFEFEEVLNTLAHVPVHAYLDVSSPCLLPLMLLMQNKNAVANMLNPDNKDLQRTSQLIAALKLANRCTIVNKTIETANYAPKTFDLITCISVLEHIPTDREAVEVMWSLLCPGGRLILTLPCMAQPLEQYISRNDYGVLSPGSDGYTFWQRYYDEERLKAVIFNITGLPAKMALYGEKSYGLFFRNASMKRLLGELYPYWRESYMMAVEYRRFGTIAELPGEGVVMLEFIKP